MKKKEEELSEEALEMIAGRFRLLSDPTRLRILHTLGDAEMNVTDIVTATNAGQANVSKHLGVMLDAGLVSRRKEGLNSIYRVSDETIFELCEVVCSRLKKQLETRQNALTGIF
ncbi:MAG TPA: metalloregulator ArsR/SmtB family transcription factor [Pyrinomonadaceae bacterium]|nr:metalloregulator ArsR/SmtB family transcription factor [Pyrinomonadaceae bacterium]